MLRLFAIYTSFLFIKLFCRQDGGIATQPLFAPTFPKPHYPSKIAITLASPRKRGGGTANIIFWLAVQYSDSPAFMIQKLFRAVTVGIEINRETIFKISEHSQFIPHLAPHQPFQNRTIPLAFRRVSVCVCLHGFASMQNFGHTRLRHPCLACPSRCINHCHSRNHCKRTIIPLLRTITLASLVKGEVLSPEKIRATTGGIALLPHHNFSFFILHFSFVIRHLSP